MPRLSHSPEKSVCATRMGEINVCATRMGEMNVCARRMGEIKCGLMTIVTCVSLQRHQRTENNFRENAEKETKDRCQKKCIFRYEQLAVSVICQSIN